jgi:hypothetical protein
LLRVKKRVELLNNEIKDIEEGGDGEEDDGKPQVEQDDKMDIDQ